MNNKEIQRKRMMTYFINAAKEIIEEEGVKALTARKVGQHAGYSYATIYNYFNDLNTLLIYCVFDYLEDCYKHLLNFKDDTLDCRQQVITFTLEYFKYFVKNPDIFQLVFVEEMGKAPKDLVNKSSKPSVSILLGETIAQCAKEGYISEEDIDLIGELIASSIHGKLLFFLNRTDLSNHNEVMQLIENEIRFLINMEGEK